MNEEVQIIIARAEATCSQDSEYCDGLCDLRLEHFSFNDAISQDWFIKLLREKGFYSQDEVVEGHTHLNEFIFAYRYGDTKNRYFQENVPYAGHNVDGVYQRVIGGAKLELCEKHNKSLEVKLKKEKKTQEEKRQAAVEKRKIKQVEKAKKLLAELGEDQ